MKVVSLRYDPVAGAAHAVTSGFRRELHEPSHAERGKNSSWLARQARYKSRMPPRRPFIRIKRLDADEYRILASKASWGT